VLFRSPGPRRPDRPPPRPPRRNVPPRPYRSARPSHTWTAPALPALDPPAPDPAGPGLSRKKLHDRYHRLDHRDDGDCGQDEDEQVQPTDAPGMVLCHPAPD